MSILIIIYCAIPFLTSISIMFTDIVGVVWCVGDIDTIIKKADLNKDKTYKKRDIELIDLKRIGMSYL